MLLKKIFSKILKQFEKKDNNLLQPNFLQNVQKNSLLFYYGNIHSQCGQDGILSEIFRRLNIEKGYFLEFGAWDGLYLSNCRFLYEKGWKGCFIEGNLKRSQNIYKYYDNIDVINDMVGFKNSKYTLLDEILTTNKINTKKIDFISIDIDGYDLEIFKSISFFPKVILIEGGFNFTPYLNDSTYLEIEQAASTSHGLQQPITYLFHEYILKGYIPVCFLQDTYLIRKDLYDFDKFRISNSSINLYEDAYNFINNEWREKLLKLRSNNIIIKNIEETNLGSFSSNPLLYK